MKKCFLPFLFSLFVFRLQAQRDTVFWFAAPEISQQQGYPSGDLDRPIYFRITAFGAAATVTISEPANPLFAPIVTNIAAGSSSTIDLTAFIDMVENKPYNTVLNYGIKISSTQLIEVYYDENSHDNPELYSLKGNNSLGTDFWLSSQNILDNGGYTPTPYYSFSIVASLDNTTVTITPTKDIVGHSAGTTFTVQLNKGQTYAGAAVSQAGVDHPAGTRVTSNNPIAITINDDLLSAGAVYNYPGDDNGGDQTIPTDRIGTEYIAMRGRLRAPYDKLFVLATANNTTITQDGSVVATINAGSTQMLTLSADATHVLANNPVYVLQLSGQGSEVGIGIIPSIQCTGSSEVAYTRDTQDSLFVQLLVPAGGQGAFLFNGASGIITAASFNPVPSTNNQWYYARLVISTAQLPSAASVIIKNTAKLFHMSVINGNTGGGCGFGYFSNFNALSVQCYNNGPLCPGATLKLSADSIPAATYSWAGPNGFSSTLQNPVISNFAIADTGLYTLTVRLDSCSSTSTTHVSRSILSASAFNLGNDTTYCSAFSRQLSTGNANTLWSTGATTAAITVTTPGIYWAQVADSCGGYRDSITIKQAVVPVFNLGADTAYCGNFNRVITTGLPRTQWSTGDTTSSITVHAPGVYWAQVSNGCGTLRDSLIISISGNLVNIGSDTTYCASFTRVLTTGNVNTLWSTGVTGSSITVNAPGVYWAKDSNACGVKVDSIKIGLGSAPVVNLGPDTTLCKNQSFTLSAGSTTNTYLWNTGAHTASIQVDTTAKYWVRVDSSGCSGSDTVLVLFKTVPLFALGNDTTVCSSDPFIITGPQGGTHYVWQDGSTDSTYSVTSSGMYVLTVSTQCGTAADSVHINYYHDECKLAIPTAFTPNGDGKNDVFRVICPCPLTKFSLHIYNRWGQMVYESTDPSAGWDGNFKNTQQPVSTFIYYLEYFNYCEGKMKKQEGNVTLLR